MLLFSIVCCYFLYCVVKRRQRVSSCIYS